MRRTGIAAVGEAPWGTHFCQFYETRQDLLETLVPYFREGIAANEFCMWVTSGPLQAEEAEAALKTAVPDARRAIEKGQVEALDFRQWSVRWGRFSGEAVARGWLDKLEAALRRGYQGLRVAWDASELESADWDEFLRSEDLAGAAVEQKPVLACCTMSIKDRHPDEILQVAAQHEFALMRHAGGWRKLKSFSLQRMEHAARESERRLKYVQNAVHFGIWDWDPDTDRVTWTPELEALYGLRPGTMRTYADWTKLVYPADIRRMESERDAAIAERRPFDSEFRIFHASGDTRWVHARGGALYDESGRAVHVFGINIDITDTRLALDTLRRQAGLLAQSHDAVIVWRFDTGIESWYPGAETLYGFAESEALGREPSELLGSIFPKPLTEIKEDLHSRGIWEGEIRQRSRDGREVIVFARLQLMRGEDGIERVLESNRDVSERRNAEEERRALALFPEENPFPVLRVSKAGKLLFANKSSGSLLEAWGSAAGQPVPEGIRAAVAGALETGRTTSLEEEHGTVIYEFSIAPIASQGYANLYGRDVSARRQTEENLRQKGAILEAINRIFHEALTAGTLDDLGRTCLTVLEELTQSRMGFIGSLSPKGLLDDISISDAGWALCHVAGAEAGLKPLGSVKIQGVFGRVITGGKSLLTNRPSEHPDSVGLPAGHPALESFLGTPLISAGQTIGMIGLGNRPGGYTQDQLLALEAVAPAIVQALLSKEAEQELAQAGQRLAAHMDNSPLAVVEFDPEFRVIRWSKEAERLFGWTADEIQGKSIAEIRWVHDDDVETVRRISAGFVSGGGPRVMIANQNYRKDGSVVQCEWYSSAIYDPRGKLASVLSLVLDVTKRKEAETALRESEERYRTIVETAGEGIWLNDPDGKTLFVNKRAAEMLGFAVEELIGHNGQEFLDKTYASEVYENRRKLSEGQSTRREFKFRRKDGSDLWAIVNSAPVQDASGRHTANISLLTDITDRKRAEDVLKSERDFVSTILETTDALVVVLDPRGRIESFNRACERLTGYAFADVQGRPLWDVLLPAEDVETIRSMFQTFKTNDFSREYENPWLTKAGERRPIAWTNAVLKDAKGRTSRIIAIGIDVTERRLAEEAVRLRSQELQQLTESLERRVEERTRELAEANARLRAETGERLRLAAAVEQADEGMAITDTGGCITYVNPAFERVSGRPGRELTGMNAVDLLSRQGAGPDTAAKAQAAIDARRAWSGIVSVKHPDGQAGEIEVAVHPIRQIGGGGVINFLVAERDVTENVRLQQHARQMQKVEALGTLAGGIAHDFNNILNPIFINVEMALLDDDLDPDLRRHLEMSLRAAERGRDLVKQIIAFSRQKETSSKPSKASPAVREVLKFLRSSLPKTIQVRDDLGQETGLVLADQTQVHQIVMNLCNNAVYAMKAQGGVLNVRLSEVEVDHESAKLHPGLGPGAYMKLVVSDTGTGMPPDVVDRAFDPFFTTKKPGEGSGMGLAVVHGIVRDHGGAVTVQSEVGKGTTFEVYLPRVNAPAPPADRAPGAIPAGTERVLLVDDEETQIRSVRKMLVKLGYRVTGRTGSAAALAAFKQHPELYDLVITDQTMPLMTGAQLAEEMLAVRKDLPIILYTGFSELIDAEGAKAIGIREYLMKPFSFQEMAEAVRRALVKKDKEESS